MTTSSAVTYRAKALLFDLDGTLISSAASVNRCWSAWAELVGLDPAPVLRGLHGRQREDVIRDNLPDVTDDELAHHAEWTRVNEMNDLDGIFALPGALDLLNALPVESWTIVTACDKALAQARLNAAGLPVPKVLVTSDELTRGKPDPEGYLLGARRLDIAAADSLVFEDASAGIEAAQRAGMRSVAFSTTAHDLAVLADASVVTADPSHVSLAVDETGTLEVTVRPPGH